MKMGALLADSQSLRLNCVALFPCLALPYLEFAQAPGLRSLVAVRIDSVGESESCSHVVDDDVGGGMEEEEVAGVVVGGGQVHVVFVVVVGDRLLSRPTRIAQLKRAGGEPSISSVRVGELDEVVAVVAANGPCTSVDDVLVGLHSHLSNCTFKSASKSISSPSPIVKK